VIGVNSYLKGLGTEGPELDSSGSRYKEIVDLL
jgi:hypothetical protein